MQFIGRLAPVSISDLSSVFSIVVPPNPRGFDLNELDLHNIRKLSCEYELFWFSGS